MTDTPEGTDTPQATEAQAEPNGSAENDANPDAAIVDVNATGDGGDNSTANASAATGESDRTAGNSNPAGTTNIVEHDMSTPQASSPTEKNSPEPLPTYDFPEIRFDEDDKDNDGSKIWWTREIWDQSRTVGRIY